MYFAGKKKKKSRHPPGHQNVDKLGVGEELGVHTLLDPLEDGTSSGLRGDLTPQLGLDAHEREDEAKAPVLQDLQHALLLLVNFCRRANQVRVTTEAAPFPKAAADTGDVPQPQATQTAKCQDFCGVAPCLKTHSCHVTGKTCGKDSACSKSCAIAACSESGCSSQAQYSHTVSAGLHNGGSQIAPI